MTTVINNPGEEKGSGAGMIIGILALIILVFVLFYYGVPALNRSTPGTSSSPEQNTGGSSSEINVDVPDEINVGVPDGVDVDVQPQE